MKPLKQYKLPLIIVASLLALALLFGIISTAVVLSRESKSVFSYGGVTVDEGMYAYFALSYKGTFLAEHGYTSAHDTPVFFRQVDEKTGKTYGKLFREELDNYVKSLLLASYLYDRTLSLTKAERENIKSAVDLIASEGKKSFNELGKPYGFDYKSLQKCAEMIYKTSSIYSLYSKSASSSATNSEEADRFYAENYAKVYLLFIRTETVFCYDEAGNRLTDEETGFDAVRTLSALEYEKRIADILSLREGIEAYKNGENGAITEITISDMLKTYYIDDSKERAESGYYLSAGEGYTKNLSPSMPNVVETALALKIGEFAEVVITAEDYTENIQGTPFVGSCFIYRAPLPGGAYTVEEFGEMFKSFYSGVGQYTLLTLLESLLPEVETGKRYGLTNPSDIPYLYQYVIRF